MVAILEPFIDTIIICTLTGVVILSSGVWKEKFQNDFSAFDTYFLAGAYTDRNPDHVQALFQHLDLSPPQEDPVKRLTGNISVNDGVAESAGFTVIHNRSIAENVRYSSAREAYTGVLDVADGRLVTPQIEVSGRSLLHSVPLTVEAFKRSFLGAYSQYAVTISLVLFTFSTALAWSYYGDRAITYLMGSRAVLPYRLLYVVGFFVATIVDTSIIWLVSAVTLALMTIPNLFGLLLMRREIKALTSDYWTRFKDR